MLAVSSAGRYHCNHPLQHCGKKYFQGRKEGGGGGQEACMEGWNDEGGQKGGERERGDRDLPQHWKNCQNCLRPVNLAAEEEPV